MFEILEHLPYVEDKIVNIFLYIEDLTSARFIEFIKLVGEK